MKMCKAMPMSILLFTGYLCSTVDVAAETMTPLHFSADSTAGPSKDAGTETVTRTHFSADSTAGPSKDAGTETVTRTHFSADSTAGHYKHTETDESGTPPPESDPVPEKRLSTTLVAGISISLVLLFILVITGIWYARRKSKAEMNSIPSGEPGVSLQSISTHENQREWPFERALP